jgi:3-oxoadipate enol-lactonase
MPFLSLRDIDLYYEEAGSGSSCLVISGTGGDLRFKPNLLDSPLSAHFRVYCYDQRGLGQSGKPEAPYSMGEYAADAAALIDSLDIAPCRVLGVSFGGMVAQELAIRYPEKIERLALFCTSPGGAGGSSYPLHELPEDADARFLQMLKIGDTRINDEWIEANGDLVTSQQAQMDRRRYAHEAYSSRGAAGQLEARRLHDCWDRLPQISCPVHLAGGLYDGIAYPDSMRNMQQRLPNSTLHFYEGGHLFMLSDPRVFPDLIEFLQC